MEENTNTEKYEEKKLSPIIQHLADAIEKKGLKVTFGLQPNHIERIESEIKRWDSYLKEDEDGLKLGWIKYDYNFWENLGKEFGWMPLALALSYFEYLENNTICKSCNSDINKVFLPRTHCPECGNKWNQ